MSNRIYPSRSKELLFEFMEEDTDECQISPMSVNGQGYAQMSWEGKCRAVSHVVWELSGRDSPPEGHVRMHLCREKRCVNGNHLRLGTQSENSSGSLPRTRMTADEKARIISLYASGYSKSQISIMLNRSWVGVHYIIVGKRGA